MRFPSRRPDRLTSALAVIAGSFVLVHWVSRVETVSARQPLRQFPTTVGKWRTQRDLPLAPRIATAAGVDEYLNRFYVDPSGASVQLYIGYYASQRSGDTVHSPKHCLPGAGWRPLSSGFLSIELGPARQLEVNEYLIEKDRERQLALYWYQNRGRAIASEYAAKYWMVRDAILRHRTDGALVRVTIAAHAPLPQVRARAEEFVRAILPHLDKYIPD